MMNHVTLMGRLSRDPELKRTGSGVAVANFSIAVEDNYKDDDGNKKAIFIDCTAWRNTAEYIAKYFTKGRMMVLSGELDVQKWKDRDGNNRTSTIVVVKEAYFGDSKKEGSGNQPAGNNSYGGSYDPNGSYAMPPQPQYSQQGYAPQQPQPQQYGQQGYAPQQPQPQQYNQQGYAPQQPQPQNYPQQGYAPQQPQPQNYPQQGFAPQQPQGGFAKAPTAPASDFAMLSDDDAQLPF